MQKGARHRVAVLKKMIKLNILEKIADKFHLAFWSNNKNKKIVNKNSPNFGNQTIAETVINKTLLKNRGNADIRKLEIISGAARNYKAKAIYSDGFVDEEFTGYWYGWQHAGGTVVWTPLGHKNSINLGESRYAEISAWANEQNDKEGADANTHASIGVGDKPW